MDEEKKQWGDNELSTFFAHKYLVREMINHFPTMHRNYHDDLQSYALAGLWRAIEEFKEGLGIPFVTWARMKIRWAIKDGLRELDLLSRTSREDATARASRLYCSARCACCIGVTLLPTRKRGRSRQFTNGSKRTECNHQDPAHWRLSGSHCF